MINEVRGFEVRGSGFGVQGFGFGERASGVSGFWFRVSVLRIWGFRDLRPGVPGFWSRVRGQDLGHRLDPVVRRLREKSNSLERGVVSIPHLDMYGLGCSVWASCVRV